MSDDTRIATANRRTGRIMAGVGVLSVLVAGCDFVTSSPPQQAPGPVIVNNTPPDSGNSVLLTFAVIGLVAAVGIAVWLYGKAQRHRERAEQAERDLYAIRVTQGLPQLNGQPVYPVLGQRLPDYPDTAQVQRQIESGRP